MGGFKFCFLERSRNKNGKGILVDINPREQVVEAKQINIRMMAIKPVVEGFTLNSISSYVPQVGLDEEVKKQF